MRVFLSISLIAALALSTMVGCAADEALGENSMATTPHSHDHHDHGVDEHAQKLQGKLGLTDEQTQQVAAALRANSTREARIAAIKAILTAEQLSAFENLLAQHHENTDPAAHAALLQEKLGLTDEQTAQIETLFRESENHGQIQAGLQQILTADQLEELRNLRREFQEQHGEPPHPPPANP